MTPDAINRACAELCGWTGINETGGCPVGFDPQLVEAGQHAVNCVQRVPPFTTSLDAVQMAFKTLTEEQQWWAGFHLAKFGIVNMLLATPFQWCEAILKATGKWEETTQ